jgi:glycosyltransferase involved in cell wall biosynthesis
MRIIFHSNADWTTTGYGTQTRIFVPRIASLGHEVIVSAFYGLNGASTSYNGHLVLPGGQDAYGSDIIAAHVAQTGANAVISLMDAWVLDRGQVRAIIESGVPFFCWCPVDCQPLGTADEAFFRETAAQPVAMSRFGQAEFAKAGIHARYAPHGIETDVFKPSGDRLALRKKYKMDKRFVIGISQANKDQIRKAWAEQMEAFARFRRRHPEANALLSVHALRAAPTGLNLLRMAERKGVADAIAFNDNYAITVGGISPQMLAEWYETCDVVMARSYGEGFGLTPLEALACGTPVIGGDFSAMAEVCGVGWQVRGQQFYNEHHGSDWSTPLIDYKCPNCGHEDGLVAALELAYEAWKTDQMPEYREKARAFALQYDADLVLEKYWKPVLAEIESMTRGAIPLRPLEKDRDATLARLQDAFNSGNLGAEEFGDRARRAMGAVSAEDLAALVADLPGEMVAA